MKLTIKEVEQVALLSRLELTGAEKERFMEQLSAVLEYMDVLNSLDTTGIEPMAHVLPLSNVFREDKVKVSLAHELAMSNAPEEENGCFRVPKVVEG